MSDPEAITSITCLNCGHVQKIGATGGHCVRCQRSFSPAQRAVHVRRLSSSHLAFGAHAGELAERLEGRRGAVYTTLAAQGRELEAEFARWASAPPDDALRAGTINALAEWSRTAHDLLSGGR